MLSWSTTRWPSAGSPARSTRLASADAGRRPSASVANVSLSSATVATGGCDGCVDLLGATVDDLVGQRCAATGPVMSIVTASPSGVPARLPTTIGRVRISRSMVCAALGVVEVAGTADGAAHVLLVGPAVEDADVQEVGDRAGPGGCHRRRVEVRVVGAAQRGQPQRDQLVPLGEHLGAGACCGATSTSCSLASPIGFLTCDASAARCSAARQTLQHPLGADQVRQVVLHRPARQVGRRSSTRASVRSAPSVADGVEASRRACRWCRSGWARCDAPVRARGSGWSATRGRRGRAANAVAMVRRSAAVFGVFSSYSPCDCASTPRSGPTGPAPRRRPGAGTTTGPNTARPVAKTMIGTPNPP